MGIVYLRDDKPFVFEAVQPVKLTPLDEWTARGERQQFVAKRLRDPDSRLTAETLRNMRAAGEQLAGKDYDPYFEWSDERIYCSELVWKIFERGAGIELGARQTIADFDLSHPAVQQKLKERYGDRVPLDEVGRLAGGDLHRGGFGNRVSALSGARHQNARIAWIIGTQPVRPTCRE
jgi:hypothetical protein